MYKRLLVPVDGSPVAESILPYALGICRATQSQLTLVRVVDDESQRDKASEYVDAMAAKLQAEGLCVHADGDIAAALLKETARVPGTLLAMTTHGRSGLLGAVMGSVAMKALRGGGKAPMLMYRPHERFTGDPSQPIEISRVLVTMDSTPSAESMGDEAAEFARWIGVRVAVISVIDTSAMADARAPSGDLQESSYVQSRATELGKRHGVEYSWEVLHGKKPDQTIADFIGNDRSTMLAMVTRANAAPVSAALLGSVATGCLRKAGVPILIRMA